MQIKSQRLDVLSPLNIGVESCRFERSSLPPATISHQPFNTQWACPHGCPPTMMTSSNENIFHVTGPLCGEFTGDRWIPLTKASDRALMFSLDWINDWLNNREADNLRRHRNSTSYRNTILSCFYLSVNSASANSAASFSIVFLAGTTKSTSWCRVFTVSTFQRSWWRHQMETFPRSWPFVWRIHRSPVNSPHKGLWRGALLFSLICAWIDGWTNNRDAGDLRRHRAHYDVTVMFYD